MSTFLQVSGAIFWLSLGAGGLWVGLCLWASRKNRPGAIHEIPRPAGDCIPIRVLGIDWGVRDGDTLMFSEIDYAARTERHWYGPDAKRRIAQWESIQRRRAQEAEARDV